MLAYSKSQEYKEVLNERDKVWPKLAHSGGVTLLCKGLCPPCRSRASWIGWLGLHSTGTDGSLPASSGWAQLPQLFWSLLPLAFIQRRLHCSNLLFSIILLRMVYLKCDLCVSGCGSQRTIPAVAPQAPSTILCFRVPPQLGYLSSRLG